MSDTSLPTPKPTRRRKRPTEHYVDNKVFSAAVNEYVIAVNEAKSKEEPIPSIPEYIGDCFVRICEGLSHAPNWIRYSYRDEMVADAIENCVRKILNFDISKATRTGLPNAFSYFTQIAYFAFIRRLTIEKKQFEIKMKYIESADLNSFADFNSDDNHGETMLSKMRHRGDTRTDDFFLDEAVADMKADRKPRFKKKVKAVTSAILPFAE